MAVVLLLRHGQTAWSQAGRHTGLTDIPLTAAGRGQAAAAAADLVAAAGGTVAEVWCSPLQRARETMELVLAAAGMAPPLRVDERLVEWDYGSLEGVTTAEQHARDDAAGRPRWSLWRDGAPGGESLADVARRAAAVAAEVWPAAADGPVLVVAHGHLLRVLAAVAVGWPASAAAALALDPAHLGVLGREHDEPVLWGWNLGPHNAGSR